jgi:hypothetical protein
MDIKPKSYDYQKFNNVEWLQMMVETYSKAAKWYRILSFINATAILLALTMIGITVFNK